MNAQARVTLVNVENVDGQPTARLESTVSIPGATLDLGGLALKIEGTAQGTSLVDVATGWARSAHVAEDLSLGVVADPTQPSIDVGVHIDVDLQLVGVRQLQAK